jgi:hypothetical protein
LTVSSILYVVFRRNCANSNANSVLYPADAKCVSLSDNKSDGLAVVHPDSTNVLVPFRENVTLTCSSTGRILRKTASAGFRQCVYDPKPVSADKNSENEVESRSS